MEKAYQKNSATDFMECISVSERSRGNGLGLFLVKKAVVIKSRHPVCSRMETRGSVFTVSLPIVISPALLCYYSEQAN